MNKVEVIGKIAEATGFTKKDITAVMDQLQTVTFDALSRGEEVKIMNGLTLNVAHKEAHTARNPRTGDTIQIGAKNVVKCKLGKAIKDAVA